MAGPVTLTRPSGRPTGHAGRPVASLIRQMRRAITIALLSTCSVTGFVILATHSNNTLVAIGGLLLGGSLLAGIAVIALSLGPQSQPDREREARAREEFDRTGRWPRDEDAS
jgi:hypothetical protein